MTDAKESRKAEGIKDAKVQASEGKKAKVETVDKKGYATYAKTTTKEANLMGFVAVEYEDDD